MQGVSLPYMQLLLGLNILVEASDARYLLDEISGCFNNTAVFQSLNQTLSQNQNDLPKLEH